MSTTYRFKLKPEQDGCGFFYGRFEVGTVSYRIDILPPSMLPRPFFVAENMAAEPAFWIVYVDGEDVSRVTGRDEIEPFLVEHLASEQLDRASSASRQHYIDTERYLRKDETGSC